MPDRTPMSTPDPGDAAPLQGAEAAQLFAALAAELRRIASSLAPGEQRRTLQPTALVNEAYLKMFGGRPRSWNDEKHFMRSAAVVMRTILLDHKKRGRIRDRILSPAESGLDELLTGMESRCGGDLLAIHEAIESLAKEDEEAAEYVTLRFFGGRTNLETIRILDISERTGEYHWSFARSWLKARLRP